MIWKLQAFLLYICMDAHYVPGSLLPVGMDDEKDKHIPVPEGLTVKQRNKQLKWGAMAFL